MILFSHAWNGNVIDPEFWQSEIGQAILKVRLWLDNDELITLKEAAIILRGNAESRDLVWINDQIKKGKLTRYIDSDEPNPQRSGRVRKLDVISLEESG